jgi:4-alpha-glucanotransferase
VDYETVAPFTQRLLDEAWRRFAAGIRRDLRAPFEEFCARQAGWLDDYALFRAHERARSGSRQLALALHRRHAVAARLRGPARPDGEVASVGLTERLTIGPWSPGHGTNDV